MTATFEIPEEKLNGTLLDELKASAASKKKAKFTITFGGGALVKIKILGLDETEYLMSTEANRKRLEEAIENVRKGNVIEVDIDEVLAKHGID